MFTRTKLGRDKGEDAMSSNEKAKMATAENDGLLHAQALGDKLDALVAEYGVGDFLRAVATFCSHQSIHVSAASHRQHCRGAAQPITEAFRMADGLLNWVARRHDEAEDDWLA